MTDRIAAWWGDRYAANLERIRAFWTGGERFLVSINSSAAPYRQCFDDAEILTRLPVNLADQARLPGVNLPAFFADFGTVSTAKHWGGIPRFDSTGGNLFIDPVAATVAEALALDPRPADDPALDPARALRLFRTARARLGSDRLWLRTPDMQGPLNTAGLIMNQEEMMMTMHEDPDAVAALLVKVTDFLIAYQRCLRAATGGMVCGNIWPYTFFPAELGVSFTEDLMPLLSAPLYERFGIPALRRLAAALGALHIHCCGDWGRHAPALAASGLDLRAVEFHWPFTTIEELEPLWPTTVFIPYAKLDSPGSPWSTLEAYFEHLLESTPPTVRFWFAWPGDSDEARAFARRHGFT